jgi:hypothetical protein
MLSRLHNFEFFERIQFLTWKIKGEFILEFIRQNPWHSSAKMERSFAEWNDSEKKKRNGSNVKRESLACNNFDRVMMIADRLLARRARWTLSSSAGSIVSQQILKKRYCVSVDLEDAGLLEWGMPDPISCCHPFGQPVYFSLSFNFQLCHFISFSVWG